jgi:DNA-binding NtrC family response regulator
MAARILLVEDDAQSRRNLARFLESSGYNIFEAENGETALALIKDIDNFDVVITDLRMPGMVDGLDVIRYQSRVSPGTGSILITGFGSAPVQSQVHSMGVIYMEKPLVLHKLLNAVRDMV